ncbi:MAG: hypothetical protein CMC04_01455 [Flavobacteriaceae bacterium]|nr:hypothetical protein [Flavobacteriaceae bacterium]
MIKIEPIDFYLPKNPPDQVFESIDIKKIKSNNKSVKSTNFFNIINKKNLKEIKLSWEKFLLSDNYNQILNSYYLLEIRSKQSTFKGILCGISSKKIKNNLIFNHEEVYYNRVKKLKNYLKSIEIQAEPVVFGTNFSKEIKEIINSTSKNKPDSSFVYKKIRYSLRKIILKESIKKFESFYVIDGHHRTASIKLLADDLNTNYKLLTFLTDIDSIECDKFIWKVSNPSINLIERLKIFKTSFSKPDSNLFWAKFDNKYYLFNQFDINHNSIINFEKWILNSGDSIDRYYLDDQRSLENDSNSIFFNYPLISFEQIINAVKDNKLLPKKTTFLKPKMLTGFVITKLK